MQRPALTMCPAVEQVQTAAQHGPPAGTALPVPKDCTFKPATSAAVTRAIVAELLAQDEDSW